MAARRPPSSFSSPPASAAGPSGFAAFGLPASLISVLSDRGIVEPFAIQAATLPDSLSGRDVLGRGETGSGKTYAFLLPLVARLTASGTPRRAGRPRALVLAPTRELAAQIDTALAPLAATARLRTVTVYGGVAAGPQLKALRAGVDVVVACPGRLEDHVSSGHVDLGSVEITVIDEADHMADLGFLPAVRRLLDRTPRLGQRMLFSATLDAGVDVLVKRYLSNPVVHRVEPTTTAPPATHHVVRVDHQNRVPVLAELAQSEDRVVVFTRTKRGASRLAKQLTARGVSAVELHGDLSQSARQRNLRAFSTGTAGTLVATDIAARGIHVDDVALVVHADPPADHKAYVHRSGRTARAGAEGTVITVALDTQLADVRALARKAGISAGMSGAPTVSAEPSTADPGRAARDERPSSRRPRRSAEASRRNRGGQPAAAASSGSRSQHPRSHSAAGFSAARRGR